MTATDVTNFGKLHLKSMETNLVKAGYVGAATSLKIDARDKTNAANNAANSVQAELKYGSTGTSTLEFTKIGAGAAGNTAPNVLISGIAEPTEIHNLANKKYVDDQSTELFSVHQETVASCNGELTINSYTPGTADGNTPSEIFFMIQSGVPNGGASGFTLGDDLDADCRCDGVLITAGAESNNNRVLILNSSNGWASSTGNQMDGIYFVESCSGMGGVDQEVTLKRTSDMRIFNPVPTPPAPAQWDKGEFVITSGGTVRAGNGYTLTETVISPTDAANNKWVLFSTQRDLTFVEPIVFRSGAWAIGGALATPPGAGNGADEGKLLVAGSGQGAGTGGCTFEYSMGQTTQVFTINAADVTINDLGSSSYTNTGGNANDTFEVQTPDFKLTSTNGITLDSLGGSAERVQFFGKSLQFSKRTGGNVPITNGGNPPTRESSIADGHLMPTTATFNHNVEKYGNGIVWGSRQEFAGAGNTNGGRYYMGPHNKVNSVDNSSCLEIMGYDDSGNQVVIAQIVPP